MHPLNDMAMIKISAGKKQLIETSKDTAESGILVELPEKFNHYSMYSFAYEGSFMNKEALDELHDYWRQYIGKKVYWLALSERGAILKKREDTFALVKLTSLIAYDDDINSKARNLHSDGSGAFKA